MNVYPAANIRNVCLLGHSGDGKTSLAESLLFMTKATTGSARCRTAIPYLTMIPRRLNAK